VAVSRSRQAEVATRFSAEQKALIATGDLHSRTLTEWVSEAIKATKKRVIAKRHWYIQSPPGLGKTYTVQQAAKKSGTELVMIQGAASLAALVRSIALAVYRQRPSAKNPLFFCVDDCDDLFIDRKSLNVMKGVLDEERNILSWEVDMSGQIAKYRKSDSAITKAMADALEHFQSDGGVGVQIPTDGCIFIVLSNRRLASDREAKAKPKLMHESAIRSRVNYRPINISGMEFWGWAASVILKTNILGVDHTLSAKQKQILLHWMYQNWEVLPGTDLREVRGFAAEMINHPDDYADRWQLRLETNHE
jgi:hypothetical protein